MHTKMHRELQAHCKRQACTYGIISVSAVSTGDDWWVYFFLDLESRKAWLPLGQIGRHFSFLSHTSAQSLRQPLCWHIGMEISSQGVNLTVTGLAAIRHPQPVWISSSSWVKQCCVVRCRHRHSTDLDWESDVLEGRFSSSDSDFEEPLDDDEDDWSSSESRIPPEHLPVWVSFLRNVAVATCKAPSLFWKALSPWAVRRWCRCCGVNGLKPQWISVTKRLCNSNWPKTSSLLYNDTLCCMGLRWPCILHISIVTTPWWRSWLGHDSSVALMPCSV